ncbi:hypothetical protein E4U53_005613 [Claviceps sorghi]|nr:hypothetical protein E4U53_005613 [Claviceps sorghi]
MASHKTNHADAVKPGQRTLRELDAYRYGEALDTFGAGEPPGMTLSQVRDLVEWKLRHGKFRPTLMSLVASNDAQTTKAVIASAIKTYRAKTAPCQSGDARDADVAAQTALDMLTTLRGVGPATASLLLSVHDPRRVIFFSDEAYWWLCCGGHSDVSIRYTAKEYRALCDEAARLVRRLGGGTQMVHVEKAAYVAMRTGDGDGTTPQPSGKPDRSGRRVGAEGETGKEPNLDALGDGEPRARIKSAKRTLGKEERGGEDAPLRRSKRLNRRGTGP